METKEVALTTIDNPFNPLEDFDHWLEFDLEKGYNSCGKLARLTHIDDSMTDEEKIIEIERGIDRLVQLDPTDLYIKIKK